MVWRRHSRDPPYDAGGSKGDHRERRCRSEEREFAANQLSEVDRDLGR